MDHTAVESLRTVRKVGQPRCEWLEPLHHTHPCRVAISIPSDQEMSAEDVLPEQLLYYRKLLILSHPLSSQTLQSHVLFSYGAVRLEAATLG